MVAADTAFSHFITAADGRLWDGDKPFRFISFNVSGLTYIEDDMRFCQANTNRLPDSFEMQDCLATLREMGGQVARIGALTVASHALPANTPSHIEAPGKFNETAFRCLDQLIAQAGDYGIRLILPLVNSPQHTGGFSGYAGFRKRPPEDFWTDPQLIADFKATIRFVLSRKNTITGIPYGEDPTIMAWETGYEITAPTRWTAEIAATLKALDSHHLVLDGSRNETSEQLAATLADDNIDLVTLRHFESDLPTILHQMEETARHIAGRKACLISEIGFASATNQSQVLAHMIARPEAFSGALISALRFHNRDGGFYWHTEPFGGIYKGLHWPGFPSGQAYDEARMMLTIRRKAFEIQGRSEPPLSLPEAPVLQETDTVTALSWKGAMGAVGYIVERAKQPDGPWTRIAPNVSDADVPYFPLFNDTSSHIGHIYYYRVRALNRTGVSAPSNVIGPITARYKAKIDTMKNLDEAATSMSVSTAGGNDRSFKEIRNRISGTRGAALVYSVPGRLNQLQLYSFEQSSRAAIEIWYSAHGHDWQKLKIRPQVYACPESSYDEWRARLYSFTVSDNAEEMRFVKIAFQHSAQLARLEILYGA